MRSARAAFIGAFLVFLIALVMASPSGATTTLIDPSGDTFNASDPDIISFSGGFDSTALYLRATFQAATLNPSNLAFLIGLDTDVNSTTGQQFGIFPIGAEYGVWFNSLGDTSLASVLSYVGGSPESIPVSFDANSFSLSVPLSLLGNDDGVASFGLVVGIPTDASSFSVTDHVPDSWVLGGPTTVVSTSPVPEPSTLLLLGSGLVGLAGIAWKHRRPA